MTLLINNLLCIGCGDCVKVCPCNAIYEQDHFFAIDDELCNGCGECKQVCCRNAIGIMHLTEGLKV